MKPDLLITTNGFKGDLAFDRVRHMAGRHTGKKITLLGVTENLNPAAIDDHHPLEDVFARAVELFQKME